MNSTDLPASNTGLTDLANRIKTAHADVRNAAKNIIRRAIDAGVALIEAKARVPHGEFLQWVEENCGFSERTAHNYMLIGANRDKLKSAIDADLTLNQALRQVRDGGERADDGPASLYDKAQATLIKKLGKLLPSDVEGAAKRTIGELEAAVAATKKTT